MERAGDKGNMAVVISVTNHDPQFEAQIANNSIVITSNEVRQPIRGHKVLSQKTKKVETRVQRQFLMEDGRIIADTGPQVISRTKEDSDSEQTETIGVNNTSFQVGHLEPDESRSRPGDVIVGDRLEIRSVSKEARKECYQYHDESVKELSGTEVYKMAKSKPKELFEPMDEEIGSFDKTGKLYHYSNKGKKVTRSDHVRELSKLGIDGQIRVDRTHTVQDEEVDDDEVPESDKPSLQYHDTTYSSMANVKKPRDHQPASRLAIGYQALQHSSSGSSKTNSWVANHFGANNKQSSTLRVEKKRYADTDGITSLWGQGRQSQTLPRHVKLTDREDASTQASFSSSDDEDVTDGVDSLNGSNNTFIRNSSSNFFFGQIDNEQRSRSARRPRERKLMTDIFENTRTIPIRLASVSPVRAMNDDNDSVSSWSTLRRTAEQRQRAGRRWADSTPLPPPETGYERDLNKSVSIASFNSNRTWTKAKPPPSTIYESTPAQKRTPWPR
ncbi:hypothetical protein HDE_07130 [Halotydeus destructor]|nr:hypothetical protein HDE_07130 [Halotydeus destructor]